MGESKLHNTMRTQIWGPIYWDMFHAVTFLYPYLSSKTLQQFFIKDFTNIIPCPECKMHYIDMIKEDPCPIGPQITKDDWFLWGFRIHNKVNEKLQKPTLSHSTLSSMYHNRFYPNDISWATQVWNHPQFQPWKYFIGGAVSMFILRHFFDTKGK